MKGSHTVVAVAFAVLALLLAAAPASATVETKTFVHGPVEIDAYQVKQNDGDFTIPTPQVDGAITAMEVDVVDRDGTPVPISRLMLHHIVFLNLGARLGEKHDATCDTITGLDSQTRLPALVERFYAAGEERAKLRLPPGYGYRVTKDDRWVMFWMLMNHRAERDRAYIQYTVTVDDDPSLVPVKPYWLDVGGCKADPVYDVPGGGLPGSVHERHVDFTMPESGRIVAGGGHVHGGGKRLAISQPGCGSRELYASQPTWGNPDHPFYNVLPVLHEPGPIHMSGFNTAQGLPVARGQTLRLTSYYDAQRLHTRVMGISVFFLAPDESVTDGCAALPGDVAYDGSPVAGRSEPPVFPVPLTGLDSRGRAITIRRPPGRAVRLRSGSTVFASSFSFSRPNVVVRQGATLRWRFRGETLHNVTIANGPRGFSSPHLNGGRVYSRRLSVPGTYRLFCALHPVDMTETVRVTPRGG